MHGFINEPILEKSIFFFDIISSSGMSKSKRGYSKNTLCMRFNFGFTPEEKLTLKAVNRSFCAKKSFKKIVDNSQETLVLESLFL